MPCLYKFIAVTSTLIANGFDHSESINAPKAYLNILLFDKNFNFVDAAYKQIGIDDIQTKAETDAGIKAGHGNLSRSIIVPEAGYAYIFLSNENPTQVDVYFDDLTITHAKSPVIQMDDYYPGGLTFNSYQRANSLDQKYLYNGKELQDELDIGWLDYGARMYDPTLVRWHVLDPLSERGRKWSPYTFSFDNAMNVIDPDGMWGMSVKEWGEQFLADAIVGDGGKSKEEKEKEEKKKAEYEEKAKEGPQGDGNSNGTTESAQQGVDTGGEGNNDTGPLDSLIPVGIIFGVGVDGYIGGGVTVAAGGVIITRGPDKGKVVYFLDHGVGLGLDLSAAGQVGALFYTGDAANFTKASLIGERVSISGALGFWGVNGFITPVDAANGRVIGILGTYGPGINPLNFFGIAVPATGNINYGRTDIFNK